MDTFLQDLKYGARMLLKSPGFTAVAALSLAIGIGANTTIFTLINALLLSPIPVADPGSLVGLFTTDERNQQGFNRFNGNSKPNFESYRDGSTTFTGMAAYGGIGLSLASGGEPEQIGGEIVSGSYFDLLGVKAALGRTFLPDEDRTPGTHPVVVLSHGLWTRRFGSDPAIINRPITLNGQGFTVVGVAPPGFRGINVLGGPELWVPFMMHPQVLSGFFLENFNDRRALLFNVFGRLKPGVSIDQAQAELTTIGGRLAREFPNENQGRNAALLPLSQAMLNPNIRQVFVLAGGLLMTVVGLVLLIACANVANLLLARASARRREIAIRLALGAGRGRLIRQLLTESVLLSLCGGAAGLLIAYWGRDLLLAVRPQQFLPAAVDLPLDARVLGFTFGVSILTGLLFGLAPALQASRSDLATELKDRSAQPSGAGRFNLRGALVVAQVALSLVALIGAGLFLRSLRNTQRIDPGFETRNVVLAVFDLAAQGYDTTRGREFHRRVIEEVGRVPGVRSAALATNLPIAGGGIGRTVFPEGVDPTDRSAGVFVTVNTVGVGYFDTLDVAIRRGRAFEETDREGTPLVVVANEAMAQRFWPGQDAVGKRFKFFGFDQYCEIVGVAGNTKIFTLGEDPQMIAYMPLLQSYEPALVLHARTAGDATALMEGVRRTVQSLEPTMPITNVQTVADLIDASLWAPRMGAALLAIFALVALVLAAIGLYGVMAYAVSRRTQEFGVRMALGAGRREVLALVLRQAMTLVAGGLGLGLVVALAVTRLITAFLTGVSPTDPLTFASISVLLVAVALAAGYVPARRATRVDPMVALRYE
jgi:predicted permease